MKILIGNKDHYDFDSPILMSPEQREDFIKLMKRLFSVVQVEDSAEHRLDRLGDKIFARKWTNDELKCLLKIEGINIVCEGLGRSWMSVDIKTTKY